jgi:hypothetical protein
MCIIAVKPEKVVFTRKQLKIMWDANPDGAGFMYAENNKVEVVKGLMTLDALWDAIERVGPMRKLVLHFRIKTHGKVSPELTHPFWITEGSLAMVHNGVIRAVVNETSEEESDTAVFARKFSNAYINPLQAIRNEFHRDMLEAYIGFSKVVFMDRTGAHYILNESLGTWHKNVWYSNDRFKPEKPVSQSTTTVGEQKRFAWEYGKFEQPDREETQRRLEEAFASAPEYRGRTDRGGKGSRVVHVTRERGSENGARRLRQRPLLGCPTTQQVQTYWNHADFPKDE